MAFCHKFLRNSSGVSWSRKFGKAFRRLYSQRAKCRIIICRPTAAVWALFMFQVWYPCLSLLTSNHQRSVRITFHTSGQRDRPGNESGKTPAWFLHSVMWWSGGVQIFACEKKKRLGMIWVSSVQKTHRSAVKTHLQLNIEPEGGESCAHGGGVFFAHANDVVMIPDGRRQHWTRAIIIIKVATPAILGQCSSFTTTITTPGWLEILFENWTATHSFGFWLKL